METRLRYGFVAAIIGIAFVAASAAPVRAGISTVTPSNPAAVLCVGAPVQAQCIKSVAITRHGTFADFSFVTLQPQLASLQVSAVAPKKQADGTYTFDNLPVDGFALTPAKTLHQAQILDLQPNTTYHFIINAGKGAVGGESQWASTFTTLKRQVTVHYTKINVIDDSDDLGNGELFFAFFINGWLMDFQGVSLTYPLGGGGANVSVGSGESIALPDLYVNVIDNAPATLTLKVYGHDDDCDFVPLPGFPATLCTEGSGPGGSPDHGSTSEQDWATANGSLNVARSGPGKEEFDASLGFSTTNDRLKFEAVCTITVRYV